MNNGKCDVSSYNIDVAVKLLENHMPTSLVRQWLALMTKRKPYRDMIDSLRQSSMTGEHDRCSDYTAAQKLLNNLEKKQRTAHTAIYLEVMMRRWIKYVSLNQGKQNGIKMRHTTRRQKTLPILLKK